MDATADEVSTEITPAVELEPFDPLLARRLRDEAHGMARAYVNALLAELHRDSISGVYAKGSAYRPWDSVVDYVPEVSDVDIHVRLAPGSEHALDRLDHALAIGARALATFTALHPAAAHTPRPQLMRLTEIEAFDGYRPSPGESVHTLHGEPYDGAEPGDYDGQVAIDDARRFRADADFVTGELASKVVDRPGAATWSVVARVAFRVAPAGPRLLTALGVDAYEAWSMNRTAVVGRLSELGHDDLAEAYADFYLAGWEGFRSRFASHDAARRALLAADRLFARGEALVPRA